MPIFGDPRIATITDARIGISPDAQAPRPRQHRAMGPAIRPSRAMRGAKRFLYRAPMFRVLLEIVE
ncbi:hypothetical protein [Stenotrophomonas nitritireducens]|uniref:hypothetical protein n=1 Tax=Stenotrophomonas nitritireducens TaxID=83617 RepID=UPI003D99656B